MLFHMIQKQLVNLVKANLSFVPMLFHMIQKLYLFTGMYGQSFVPMLFHMIQKPQTWISVSALCLTFRLQNQPLIYLIIT